jgi:hypothetical protein
VVRVAVLALVVTLQPPGFLAKEMMAAQAQPTLDSLAVAAAVLALLAVQV